MATTDAWPKGRMGIPSMKLPRCGLCSGTGTRDVIDGMGTVEAVQRIAGWYAALDDALVVHWCWKPGHDTDPRKALNDLICDQMSIALDPAVSEEAATLRDTYLAERDAALAAAVAEMRERAAKVAEKRAAELNVLGRDAQCTQLLTHAEIQYERLNEAKGIAAAIRALPLTTEEPK